MTLETPFSVSQLSHLLKQVVEHRFSDITLKGEISAPKKHVSGHVYFTLKDADATLDAICWRPQAARFAKELVDGAEVICRGRVTTYPLRSKYQFIAEHVESSGEGALLKLIEMRKQKLNNEGLFDTARKRKLPFIPRAIGLITSPTGAVIRDILHRLSDRFPCAVYLWPVNVQGDTAAGEITRAIEGINRWVREASIPLDVLIIARGGGSLEDLAAFNEENVVRAVAASHIPVISAVGHETDTTLIDYAADVRAPTPTAAAEFAVPVRSHLLEALGIQEVRLRGYLSRFVERSHLRIDVSSKRLPSAVYKVHTLEQRTDEVMLRLNRAHTPLFRQWQQKVAFLGASLKTPDWIAQQGTLKLSHMASSLTHRLAQNMDCKKTSLGQHTAILEAFSYKNTLRRGFCLVQNPSGGLVTRAASLSPQEIVCLSFQDGSVESQVTHVELDEKAHKFICSPH